MAGFKPFKRSSRSNRFRSWRREVFAAPKIFSPASGVIEYNISNPKGLRHYHLVEPRNAAVMNLSA